MIKNCNIKKKSVLYTNQCTDKNNPISVMRVRWVWTVIMAPLWWKSNDSPKHYSCHIVLKILTPNMYVINRVCHTTTLIH